MSKLSTRDKIISASINMFYRHGYAGARTSEIAKEAGCAEGTIFRYFPKKIDLLKNVAEEFIVRFAGGIATKTLYEILEKSDDMTAEELLEAVLRDRFKLVKENYELIKIMFYEINFHEEVKELFISHFMENIQGIGHQLTRSLSEKLGTDELEEMTVIRTIIGQMMGIFIQSAVVAGDRSEENLEEMIQTTAQIIINGLKGAVK